MGWVRPLKENSFFIVFNPPLNIDFNRNYRKSVQFRENKDLIVRNLANKKGKGRVKKKSIMENSPPPRLWKKILFFF